jgi:diguanylate cyclase (GGDEF)-like protein
MSLQWSVVGTYATALVHILRALSLAHQVRAAAAGQRGELQAELDATTDWIADRTGGAPANFEHLHRLVEAERAWAAGDFRAATLGFDAAQQAVATRQRPWHRALIRERAARFALAHGLAHTGQLLLAGARDGYADWGAKAKVDRLDWAYPALPEQHPQLGGRLAGMTGTIDLVGILGASQALSSETSIDGVRARVVEVLGTMTGATAVHLLMWDAGGERWLTGQPGPGGDAAAIDARELPVSAIRYVERTREALVVDDATRDDRFARDPYVARLQRCSLLVAPVLNQGRLRGMLVLENRLIRGAFASDRLTGVMMIAGQLAVTLDNALVYASLELRVAERTEDLALANEKLTALSITDALTGLANRRRLEEVLSAEWLRSLRSGAPVSLAMIDIDRFKTYNDQYGHAAGDRCLQQVASLLRHGVRTADLVARYGGEEFVVLMPATDLGVAVEIAERLRAAVAISGSQPAGNQEPGQEAEVTPYQVITISIGVATLAYTPHVLVEHLIEQADAELYRAKRGGRNQVRPAADRRTDPAASWGRTGDLR